MRWSGLQLQEDIKVIISKIRFVNEMCDLKNVESFWNEMSHIWFLLKIGDGFWNQFYLMIHLVTFANLLIQFQHKKQRVFLLSMYLQQWTTYLIKFISVAWQFDNVSMIRRDVR